MGAIQFLLLNRDALSAEAAVRTYMVGLDGIPSPTRCRLEGAHLIVERDTTESGTLHVPWLLTGRGEQIVSTASLMEGPRVYRLEIELARGLIAQLGNQQAAWQSGGLCVSEELRQRLSRARARFGQIVVEVPVTDHVARETASLIDECALIGEELATQYALHSIGMRRGDCPELPTLLGINLGRRTPDSRLATRLAETFHLALIPTRWSLLQPCDAPHVWDIPDAQIQVCEESEMRICAGPLLQLDAAGIPRWTLDRIGDVSDADRAGSLAVEHVQAVVTRYRGHVQLWHMAARIHRDPAVPFSEHVKLEILARAIEAVRQMDPGTPLVVSFDQPWGEFLAQDSGQAVAPIHLADTLLRAEVGLSGLGLEISSGYHPLGTPTRSLIDFSRQLDHWSVLACPLAVAVRAPSGSQVDVSLEEALAGRRTGARVLPVGPRGIATPDTQREWVERHLPLLLAKSCVQLIFWNQLCDDEPDGFPHAGLLNTLDQFKPAFDALKSIRARYLN
jgi:hypothetical protein